MLKGLGPRPLAATVRGSVISNATPQAGVAHVG